MPTAPPSRCTQHGCHELVDAGARCPEHRPKPWAQRSRFRPTGNTRKAKAFRDEHLRLEPHCRHCAAQGSKTPGEQVDHITPLWLGGARYDHANAQTLCAPHHEAKTRREASLRARMRAASRSQTR
ncbi:HNH endonuclease [Streptomyces sp. ID05-26A]|nr:HNH endonuclease [Streptomyces sp. ID05-26A]